MDIRINELTTETLVNEVGVANPLHKEIVSLEKLMEMSKFLANSTVVPIAYQNRPENCLVALDMANRTGLSPLVIMQNLHVIQGKPSFSGSAMASMIRTSPQFEDVSLHYVGNEKDDSYGAYVSAKRKSNGEVLKGGTVTIGVAKAEGWYQKTGSKWKTMPEIMLAYRAYAWFGRVYAPELTMGLQSTEEVEDVGKKSEVLNPFEK